MVSHKEGKQAEQLGRGGLIQSLSCGLKQSTAHIHESPVLWLLFEQLLLELVLDHLLQWKAGTETRCRAVKHGAVLRRAG